MQSLAFDDGHIPTAVVQRLLDAVGEAQEKFADVAQHRKHFLAVMAELVGADFGWWLWGRGRAEDRSLTVVATITYGYTEQQFADFMQFVFDSKTVADYQSRVLNRLGNAQHITIIRRDLYTDEEWPSCDLRTNLDKFGYGGWINSFYHNNDDDDTFSSFSFSRRHDRDDFTRAEATLVDLTQRLVPWLRSAAKQILPHETFVGLASRKRTIIMLLLGGVSRKSIARQLKISEATINAHINDIYRHFDVKSFSELSSLFLSGR